MALSLENQCGIPALVVILNHPLLKKEIFRLYTTNYSLDDRHAALQSSLSEFLKDYHYVLKTSVKKKIVPLIGFEMWRWAKYLKEYFNLPFEFSENFIKSSLFTCEGLLDEEKAARELLEEPSFSIFLKYNIACQYFLEDIIPTFWQVLQRNETDFKKMLIKQEHPTSMILWHTYLKKKNSTSKYKQKVIRRRFKIDVFSYGLKYKNLAAVKFSLGSDGNFRKNKREAEIIRRLVYKSFCNYINLVLRSYDYYSVYIDYLCKPKFIADRNIILYFISLLSKEEVKEFFLKFKYSLTINTWLLFSLHQNQFMDFAHLVYDDIDVLDYHYIMTEIIDLLDQQYVCQSYNYHLLLKQFWIESPPSLKQPIIAFESEGVDGGRLPLITLLFQRKNLTAEDFSILSVILENANSTDRINIFFLQGEEIFLNLILFHDNHKLAYSFLEKFDLNRDYLKEFKKDFIIFNLRQIFAKQSMEFIDEIFKWAAGNEEIEHFKAEILNRKEVYGNTEYIIMDIREFSFKFLTDLLKWYRKTDEETEEGKNNLEFSLFTKFRVSDWFYKYLKYRGYSQERQSDIKKDLLFEKLPEIARSFLNYPHVSTHIGENIYFLCLCEKENVIEFTDHIRSFYEDSMKQNMCVLCLNNNYVHVNEEEAQLNCERHGTQGFVSLSKVNRIFSEFFKDIEWLVRNYSHFMNPSS